ncbi:ferredoxin [Streptomyces lydicus]|uniref:ferredoxin n=1 Tax=Streptomyces lydicus TaxID=47763 RepID=UPI0037B5890B
MLAGLGGTLGAGAVVTLLDDTCPLGETARIAAWPAAESAGQCCQRGEEEAGTRLEVDRSRCTGHGLCAVLAPDLIRLGPHGYPTSTGIPVASWQERGARRAVNQCPALAVRLQHRV